MGLSGVIDSTFALKSERSGFESPQRIPPLMVAQRLACSVVARKVGGSNPPHEKTIIYHFKFLILSESQWRNDARSAVNRKDVGSSPTWGVI